MEARDVNITKPEADAVELDGVEALSETESGLVCRFGAKRFEIPRRLMLEGSQLRVPGDCGRLVVSRSLAQSRGLASR